MNGLGLGWPGYSIQKFRILTFNKIDVVILKDLPLQFSVSRSFLLLTLEHVTSDTVSDRVHYLGSEVEFKFYYLSSLLKCNQLFKEETSIMRENHLGNYQGH